MDEIENISKKVGKNKEEILKIIEIYSKDSVSFMNLLKISIKITLNKEKLDPY